MRNIKRYERIEELREKIDWRYLYVQERHYPIHMVNLETVQKAEEKQREAIATLRRTLKALEELKELTGIEAKVCSTCTFYKERTFETIGHNEYLYEIGIPAEIWGVMIAKQEVSVTDPEEVEESRKMEYKVQKCEDPDCPCYGQELVDRGYGYPVCPSTQQK